ncbi:MAG: TolC family protein [Candidatus Cryptobacteroides sp.]
MKILNIKLLTLIAISASSVMRMIAAGPEGILYLDQQKCRDMALAASEDLQKSENSAAQAELDRKIAFSGFLPAFDASASAVFVAPDTEMSGMELIMRGTYLAGITLTQPLYAGGKIVAGHRLAKIGEEAAEEQCRKTRTEVIYDADNAYWTYVSVIEKQKMMDALSAQMDTLFSQVGASIDAGMAVESDLLTVKAKRSEVLYQKQKVESGARLCRMALCRIVGVPFDTRIEVADPMSEDFSQINPEVDIAGRPEMKLLQAQVDAAKQQVRMTRGDWLPSLAIVGGYINFGNIKMKTMVDVGDGTYMPYEQKIGQGLGTAMLSLSVPIFKWGQNYNKVRKAKLDVDNALLDLQKNERLLTLEAQQASMNLTDSYMLLETAEAAMSEADENLRVMKNRYSVSMVPLSDLLDAQSQWQQSRSNLIEAITQTRICTTDYLRATGRLVN